jgi:hypothetical protein
VRARLADERARSADDPAGAAVACLDKALAVYEGIPAAASPAVGFKPGGLASPYPWTVARCGPFAAPPPKAGGGHHPRAIADHPRPNVARMVAEAAIQGFRASTRRSLAT